MSTCTYLSVHTHARTNRHRACTDRHAKVRAAEPSLKGLKFQRWEVRCPRLNSAVFVKCVGHPLERPQSASRGDLFDSCCPPALPCGWWVLPDTSGNTLLLSFPCPGALKGLCGWDKIKLLKFIQLKHLFCDSLPGTQHLSLIKDQSKKTIIKKIHASQCSLQHYS